MLKKCGFHISLLLTVALIGLPCRAAVAAEKETEKLSGWQRLFRKHAAAYKIVIDGDKTSEVKLITEPILQWSQPVRGGADGAIFVWTQAGRPVAICTLFIWPIGDGRQGIAHELHSLSQAPLSAAWNDRKWAPPRDSITWTALSGAPAPAATAEVRLRQMRESARLFQAESRDKNDRKWTLRLLPRPIYRYEVDGVQTPPTAEPEVLDGAVFRFVEGTDLEIVLLLQARKTAQGREWEYALARMSDFRLKVTQGDKTVWEVGPDGYDNPRGAYYCVTVEMRKSAEGE